MRGRIVSVASAVAIMLALAAVSGAAATPDGRIVFVTDRAPTLERSVEYAVDASGHHRTLVRAVAPGVVATSRDGRRDLVVTIFGGNEGLVVRDRRSGEEMRITPARIVAAPEFGAAFSPDGRSVVFDGYTPPCSSAHCAHLEVYVVGVDGMGLRAVDDGIAPAWSPDGRLIAYAGDTDYNNDPGAVFVARRDGSHVQRIGRSLIAAPGVSPLWAPRGARLAYLGAAGPASVVIADARGHRRFVFRGRPQHLTWSSDGSQLAFDRTTDAGLAVVRADGRGLRTVLPSVHSTNIPLAWSPDRSRLVVAHGRPNDQVQLYVVRVADGRLLRRLTNEPPFTTFSRVRWSRNGTITYTAFMARNDTELASIRADGTGLRMLTRDRLDELDPAVTDDGSRIVFAQSDGNRAWLVTVASDGSGLRRLTTPGRHLDGGPAWSPDGSKVAFVRFTGVNAETRLEVVNADGSGLHAVLPVPAFLSRVSWSADGRRIAFTAPTEHSLAEVFTVNADGSGLRQLTHVDFAVAPRFSPDGTRILFDISAGDNLEDLAIVRSDGSDVRRVAAHSAFNDGGDWSPDGARIVFASGEGGSSRVVIADADGTGATLLTGARGRNLSPSWAH